MQAFSFSYYRQKTFSVRSLMAVMLLLGTSFLLGNVARAASEPLVYVSVTPQKYLLDRIASGLVESDVLVQPGHNPHSYDPSARQMGRLARADMLMTTGVPFEQVWLPRIRRLNPEMTLIDTLKGIEEQPESYPDRHDHAVDKSQHNSKRDHDNPNHTGHSDDAHQEDHADHSSEHQGSAHQKDSKDHKSHDHNGQDPHVWMDPIKAMAQARIMTDALKSILPSSADQLESNYRHLADEFQRLDHEIHEQLAAYEGRTFMVFHPAWGHFSARYHLEQIAIEYQGKSPSARQLVKLSEKARAENIKVILVQEQFNQKPAERIAENIGAKVVKADPLPENLPAAIRELSQQLLESWR